MDYDALIRRVEAMSDAEFATTDLEALLTQCKVGVLGRGKSEGCAP